MQPDDPMDCDPDEPTLDITKLKQEMSDIIDKECVVSIYLI